MTESLYRFYSYSENDLHSLAGCYLWFSKLKDFNDPFEGVPEGVLEVNNFTNISDANFITLFTIIMSKGGDSQAAISDRLTRIFIQDNREQVKNLMMKSQLDWFKDLANKNEHTRLHCCFCRDDESKAIKNKQMWSLYADGLRGFVLEFCKQSLENGIEQEIGRELVFAEMIYDDKCEFDVIKLLIETVKQHDSNNGMQSVFSRKDTYWAYENELRYSDSSPVGDNKYRFPVDTIKSITLGEKMEVTKRTTLIAILKSIGIDIDVQINFAKVNTSTLQLDIVTYKDFLAEE